MSSRGYWIWTATEKKLTPNLFLQEMLVVPHYSDRPSESNVQCLTIFRKNHKIPMFVPLRCQEERRFICQKDASSSNDNIVQLFSIKADKKNFTLYSGKLTWSDAVVQCRQRGFQIAEISSLNEAQILSSAMLRVRPRAVENAWIGGHLRDRIWKWLPTGSNVSRNKIWKDKYMISGDCLLLDRHACELPTYVSTKCDRKRNFLCQTLTEKEIDLEPIAVTVDSCQYWIGLHPLKWLEASQSCKKLNATLVVLDSRTTINHVIHIMIDNRGQLQHIWIDGRRLNNSEESNNITRTIWKWESSDEKIPDRGESFIPWYEDNRMEETSTTDIRCLNMDRENFDVPIVYGLNCNNEQKYICQQWTPNCNAFKETNEILISKIIIQNDNITTLNLKLELKEQLKNQNVDDNLNAVTMSSNNTAIDSTTSMFTNQNFDNNLNAVTMSLNNTVIDSTTSMFTNQNVDDNLITVTMSSNNTAIDITTSMFKNQNVDNNLNAVTMSSNNTVIDSTTSMFTNQNVDDNLNAVTMTSNNTAIDSTTSMFTNQNFDNNLNAVTMSLNNTVIDSTTSMFTNQNVDDNLNAVTMSSNNTVIDSTTSMITIHVTEQPINVVDKLDELEIKNQVNTESSEESKVFITNEYKDIDKELSKNTSKLDNVNNDKSKEDIFITKIKLLKTNVGKSNERKNLSNILPIRYPDFSFRLFNSKLNNKNVNIAKGSPNYTNEKDNQHKKLSTTMNFKDIIEFMINNFTQNKSKEIIDSPDNIGRSNVTDLSDKILKKNKSTQEILVKENILKIIESSINKSVLNVTSTTPRSIVTSTKIHKINKKKNYINNSYTHKADPNFALRYFDKTDSVTSKKLLVESQKIIDRPQIPVNDTNTMFNLGQAMKNIFYNDQNSMINSNSMKVLNSLGIENSNNDYIINSSIAINENIKNNDLKLKNLFINSEKSNISNRSFAYKKQNDYNKEKKINFKNTVQPLYEKNKERNNMQFNDLMEVFRNDFNESNLSKQPSLTVTDNAQLGLKSRYIKPWNALLKRLFESLNNTKINNNKKVIKFPSIT